MARELDIGLVIRRRPAGWSAATRPAPPSNLGDWLARAAELEAASVHAFVGLARELEHHGAPAELVGGAWTAAREEVRHARLTASLARARGGSPLRTPRPPRRLPELQAIAEENAVEGCVRETFGAALAAWQALAAGDPGVRALMAAIAREEAAHAALAFRVQAWALARLDLAGRRRVADAARDALEALDRTDWNAAPAPLALQAGLPSKSIARALVSELVSAVDASFKQAA